MQGCIVLPCISMGVGVVQQRVFFVLDDVKAMVSYATSGKSDMQLMSLYLWNDSVTAVAVCTA
jgi:hypothetical protein